MSALRDKSHAGGFLNSLTDDIQYTIEYPSHDGYLSYIDILIHADKSTSVYRKPIHTNLYVRYNSCAPLPSKDSVIRSLTRRAHILYSYNTYKNNWTQSTQPPYKTDTPDRVKRIMDSVKQKLENPNKLTLKQFNSQLKTTTPSSTASFPFHPTITKKIKKSLESHDIKVTSSSGTTLRDLLTKTKTTPPPHLTPNVIYEISCNDCTATYNGQTNRPLIKRIKEQESHSRLHLHNQDDFNRNQSAPAHHSRTTGHKISWDRTTLLTTTRYNKVFTFYHITSLQIVYNCFKIVIKYWRTYDVSWSNKGRGSCFEKHFFAGHKSVNIDFEIAVDQQTKVCNRSFEGVPDSGYPPVPARQPRPYLVNFSPILPNHLNVLKTIIWGALLVAANLLYTSIEHMYISFIKIG